MTKLDLMEDRAYISYRVQGWIKIMSVFMLGVFIFGIIEYYPEPIMIAVCVLGMIMFGAILTYRVETIIEPRSNNAYHRLTLFGLCRKKTLPFSKIHMSARMHRTQHVSYPILWLVTDTNKKYKVGEFFGQDVDEIANKISAFSDIAYKKSF